jgi:hypothetical protein
MALEGHNEWDWWSTFLNPANHAPGTPLDWASFHFYASCSNRTDPSGYTAFFAAADGFVDECGDIATQQRDVLNPSMKLDADGACHVFADSPTSSKWTAGFRPTESSAHTSFCFCLSPAVTLHVHLLRCCHRALALVAYRYCRAGCDSPGRQLALRA